MPALPIRVEPLGEETISSWLLRTAKRYRIPIPELITASGGRATEENIDPDVCFHDEVAGRLAYAMAVDPETIVRLGATPGDLQPKLLPHRYRFFYCPRCWRERIEQGGEAYIDRRWIRRDTLVCPLHPVALTCEPANAFFLARSYLATELPAIEESCTVLAKEIHAHITPSAGGGCIWTAGTQQGGSKNHIFLDGRLVIEKLKIKAERSRGGYNDGPIARQLGERLQSLAKPAILLPVLSKFDTKPRRPCELFLRRTPPVYRRDPPELVRIDRPDWAWNDLQAACSYILNIYGPVTSPAQAVEALGCHVRDTIRALGLARSQIGLDDPISENDIDPFTASAPTIARIKIRLEAALQSLRVMPCTDRPLAKQLVKNEPPGDFNSTAETL